VLVATTVLLGASTASATFQPTVLYQPPVVKALDYVLHDSVENVVIEQHGRYALSFLSTPSPLTMAKKSDPGCGFISGGVTCPAAGLTRLIVKLGSMNDTAMVDLGRYAGSIKQAVNGGSGLDELELTGRAGAQRLAGGSRVTSA
jgi:hypothetical protein